jgi:hypothetical protein
MTTVTYQGIQFTEKMLKDEKTSDLVATYNKIAEANGETPVKKFADRATAEKRVWAILQKYGKATKREAKAQGERRSRVKRFNYVAIGQPKPRRESTPDKPVLRDMILTKMLTEEGITFNQAVKVVHDFDAKRKKLGLNILSARDEDGRGKTAETRAYEAIRLIHYYLNYSTKQDGEGDDAPIRVVGNRRS